MKGIMMGEKENPGRSLAGWPPLPTTVSLALWKGNPNKGQNS